MITNLLTTSVSTLTANRQIIRTEVATLKAMEENGTRTTTTRGNQTEDSFTVSTRIIGNRSMLLVASITTRSKRFLSMMHTGTLKNLRCNITKRCQSIKRPNTGMGSQVPTGTSSGTHRVRGRTIEDSGTVKMEMQLKADTFTTQETTIDDKLKQKDTCTT